jgi:outer membrane beta-barrel protein
MKRKIQAMRTVATLVLGFVICLPTIARAEKERKSPLTDAPVIRKRVELRDKRFEIGVGAGVTIGQDFYNAMLVMPKMAFHITDWLSLAGVGGFNVMPTWKSSFNSDLTGALPSDTDGKVSAKPPYREEALSGYNRINYLAVGQLEFIPLSGKIALLSSLFTYFDFYVLVGGGIINLVAAETVKSTCVAEPPDPSKPEVQYCHGQTKPFVTSEVAFTGGVGVHAFLGRWAALNLELHDLIYKNNASGRDVNGDKTVDSKDQQFTNNYLFSLNFQFFFPTTPKISR